jgi:hypothetical protein
MNSSKREKRDEREAAMSSETKLVLEIEVEGFNAEGIAEFIRGEEEAGEPPYSASDYLFDAGASPEVALGWTAPEADNQRTIVAFNGRIVGARVAEPQS